MVQGSSFFNMISKDNLGVKLSLLNENLFWITIIPWRLFTEAQKLEETSGDHLKKTSFTPLTILETVVYNKDFYFFPLNRMRELTMQLRFFSPPHSADLKWKVIYASYVLRVLNLFP